MPREAASTWRACHYCGKPIAETEGVVIIDNHVYHPQHQPTARFVLGKTVARETIIAPSKIVAPR